MYREKKNKQFSCCTNGLVRQVNGYICQQNKISRRKSKQVNHAVNNILYRFCYTKHIKTHQYFLFCKTEKIKR